MTKKKLAGKCLACEKNLYYIGGDFQLNIEGAVDVYMKPHYGSKFADRNDTHKCVKCFVCDSCFEEMMKSLKKSNVLDVKNPFQQIITILVLERALERENIQVIVKSVIELTLVKGIEKISITGKIILKDVRRIERSIKRRYELREENMKETG